MFASKLFKACVCVFGNGLWLPYVNVRMHDYCTFLGNFWCQWPYQNETGVLVLVLNWRRTLIIGRFTNQKVQSCILFTEVSIACDFIWLPQMEVKAWCYRDMCCWNGGRDVVVLSIGLRFWMSQPTSLLRFNVSTSVIGLYEEDTQRCPLCKKCCKQ